MRRYTKPLNGNFLPLCGTADTFRAPLSLRSRWKTTGRKQSWAQVTNVPSKLLTLYTCIGTNSHLQGSDINQSRYIDSALKNNGCVPLLSLPRPLTSNPSVLHLDAQWPESCWHRKVSIHSNVLKQMNILYLWMEISGIWYWCCFADGFNE